MPTANLGDISVLAEALVAGLSLAQVNGELLEHVLINQTQIIICYVGTKDQQWHLFSFFYHNGY